MDTRRRTRLIYEGNVWRGQYTVGYSESHAVTQAIINSWGACAGCPADIAPPPNGDNVVNTADLLAIINPGVHVRRTKVAQAKCLCHCSTF
jgi:hypothetical protein